MPDLWSLPFAAGLRRHGSRPAVITPDGAVLSYAALAERVAERVAELGPGRRLVQVAAANEAEPLITYLTIRTPCGRR